MVKKAVIKKAVKKVSAKKASSSKKKPVKKTIKKTVKSKISDKEREFRAANLIANSEKKKSPKIKSRPKKHSSNKEIKSLLDAVIEGMQDKKAKNITVLNLAAIENRVSDYYIICDADSKTHVSSIFDSVVDTVEKLTTEKPYHFEGHQNSEWILIDYINIVAHVFLRETREFYNIEGMWGDAQIEIIN
ncbi:MAG: ribosome silencing factor [Bacteroidetes bacterium]|nr:ribosome silencing factor [Bacteroidota bacterium]